MNEDARIGQLINEYTQTVTASEKLRHTAGRVLSERPPKIYSLRIPIVLAGAAVAIAVVASLLFAPSAVEAYTWRQVKAAVADSRTVRMVSYVRAKDGRLHLNSVSWWQGENRRIAGRIYTARERTYILSQGRMWIYNAQANVATVEPYDPKWFRLPPPGNALDFLIHKTDLRGHFSVQPHPDVDGRAAYKIVATGNDGRYRGEIVVEKDTDLPIRSRVATISLDNRVHRETVRLYYFNETFASDLFKPVFRPDTRIIDLEAEQARLKQRWAEPLKTVRVGNQFIEVRDLQVNEFGEVFMAYSYPEVTDDGGGYMAQFLPTSLQDSRGTLYLQIGDYMPGGVRGDTNVGQNMKLDGRPLALAVWVPIEPLPPNSIPREVTLGFGIREWTHPHQVPGTNTQVKFASKLPPAFNGAFPQYSVALVLDDFHLGLAILMATIRADYYHDQLRDYAAALRWYLEAFERNKRFVPYIGHRYLTDALKCLEALGRDEEAARVRRQIEEVKASDPNLPMSPGR